VDPATGKEAFVAVEAAAVLVAVVGAVLEAGEASDVELAAFVRPLHAALDECVGMFARMPWATAD
jgi:hypothetical protein